MTFSSYDETDDIEETDDFDDESQDSYLDEEDDDVVDLEDEEEDDLDDAATALSRAFREAAGADTVEDDSDEKEDSAEEADDDDAEADDDAEVDDDTEAAEQLLAEAIDALPDEEDLEVVVPSLEAPSLEAPSLEVGFLRPQEQDNLAYADAVTAYYEEKDYQRAIEKFGEAIENEIQHTEGNVTNSSSIVVKAMYWQAEAYVKMQDISQAIVTFENLIQTYQEHYLSLAAQRRTAQLNPK
ncbi:MAG: tetratricopeptide repeat protein [Candidatus Poribacteria bacterium]|nr:tetratricopeptide repeat protein [Candidatus Poribacteria bacterium]